MNPETSREWLTIEECAAVLCLTKGTVSGWARRDYFGLKRKFTNGHTESAQGRRQYFNKAQLERVMLLVRRAHIRHRSAIKIVTAIDEGRIKL